MSFLQAMQSVPLTMCADGSIRVQGTRVSLDSVVHHFQLGSTAEEIAQKFPSVSLADIYSTIAYFLNNRGDVEKYLARQERDATALESGQDRMEGIRLRLLSRRADS